MNNQFCKKCGQANFPEATTCTKCGIGLSGLPNQNPFNASQEPPPTMMANQQFSNSPNNPPKEQKSNKIFWIIGGAVAFIVLALGGLGVIAAVGGYFYFSSADKVEREYPAPPRQERTPDRQTTNDRKSGTLTDSQLVDYMKNNRSRIGRYRLDNVKVFKGNDFADRTAGVTALYINGSKRVVHSIAMFKSREEAMSDFGRYKRNIRRMKGSRVRSSANNRLIFSHKGSVFLAFCNENGGCHEIISKDGNTILDYYNKYFGYSN